MSKQIEKVPQQTEDNYFKDNFKKEFGEEVGKPIIPDTENMSNYSFQTHTLNGTQFNGTSRQNLSGTAEEFLGEMAQNTNDGGGKKIEICLTEIPRVLYEEKLGMKDFFTKLDSGEYVIKDDNFAKVYKSPIELFNETEGDFLKTLIVSDNGQGLSGNYNYMFSPAEFLENLQRENPEAYETSVAANQEKFKEASYKPGGAEAYLAQDSLSSKGDGEGGSHNTGGKTTAEMASLCNLALIYNRRKEDDQAFFSGHSYVGMRSGNKRSLNQRALLHKENGDLIDGKEAADLAKAFGIYRKSGEFGLTTVIPFPNADYTFHRILGHTLKKLMHMILNHNFTIVVNDQINGYYVEVNKSNFIEVFEHLCKAGKTSFVENSRNAIEAAEDFKSICKSYKYAEYMKYMYDFANSTTYDTAIKVQGYDPSNPELSEEDKKVALERFHKGIPNFFEFKMKLRKKNFSENEKESFNLVSTKFYMVVYPHGGNLEGMNCFDRSGINIRFNNGLKEEVSSIAFLPKGEEINNFCRLAEDTNHTNWNTQNNSYLKATYESTASPIRHLKNACRSIVDYLFNDGKDDRDTYTLSSIFPDEEDFSYKSNCSTVGQKTSLKTENSQDWNDIKEVSGDANSVNIDQEQSPYVEIVKNDVEQMFTIRPTLEAKAEEFVPDIDISLAFSSVGVSTNHRYGSTKITDHWKSKGVKEEHISFNENGTVMHIRDISNFDFEISISNPDHMRTPILQIIEMKEEA